MLGHQPAAGGGRAPEGDAVRACTWAGCPRALPSTPTHACTLSSLTVDEELGSLQLAGNTRRAVPTRHGLPVPPGPGDPWRGRALDAAQQAHALPDLDCHIPQRLGKARGSWRESSGEGAQAGPTPRLPHSRLCAQLSPEKRWGCKTHQPGTLKSYEIDLKRLVFFQIRYSHQSFYPFQLRSAPSWLSKTSCTFPSLTASSLTAPNLECPHFLPRFFHPFCLWWEALSTGWGTWIFRHREASPHLHLIPLMVLCISSLTPSHVPHAIVSALVFCHFSSLFHPPNPWKSHQASPCLY